MRYLGVQEHIARINDGTAVHEILFRRPTKQEIAAYTTSLFKRKGNQIIQQVHESRIKFGLRIMLGFVKGTLSYQGKPFSSDPNDPDYRKDWKLLFEKSAPDIVMALAQTIFEGTSVNVGEPGEGPEFIDAVAALEAEESEMPDPSQ